MRSKFDLNFFYFFALSFFKLRNREQEKVDTALLMNVKRCQLRKVQFFCQRSFRKLKTLLQEFLFSLEV
jgi:hypothetical protein